jgi:hypothetical protein
MDTYCLYDLNLIEFAWAKVKHCLKRIIQLKIGLIYCRHVICIKKKRKYQEKDGLREDAINEIIVCSGEYDDKETELISENRQIEKNQCSFNNVFHS